MIAALVIGLLAASIPVARPAADVEDMCAIGRLALKDLPSIDRAPSSEKFYGGRTTQYHRDVLEACPKLRRLLPRRFRPATEATFKRERDIVSSSPVTIFYVEVPQLNADRTRATIRLGYYCNGLCGAEYEETYVREKVGWVRQGEPRIKSIS